MKKLILLIKLLFNFLWAVIFVFIIMLFVLIEHIFEKFKIRYR
jgi:hypothetical protein